MRRFFLMMIALLTISAAAQAQVQGVNVQVSSGRPVPTVAQLQTVLNPGDFVRDMLIWQNADPLCNLAPYASHNLSIPTSMAALYNAVQTAGGKNFVTLGWNNVACGQSNQAGTVTFPNTHATRVEFGYYAVAALRQVPAIGAISIWNELNGTWNGGYTTEASQLENYCLLSNQVINDVRAVNKTIPIAIGATVGWNVGGYIIDMFKKYGCGGMNDPTIWIDVHPYLTGATVIPPSTTDWTAWNNTVAAIRAAGITNPLVGSEWGSAFGYNWDVAHPGSNYITTFESAVVPRGSSWGGLMWYELLYDGSTPNAGLFALNGTTLTTVGKQYVAAFKH